MKTKTVTVARAKASFSSSAQHVSTITLARAPWEVDDAEDDQVAEPQKAPEIRDQVVSRGLRHLGPYSRDRKNH